MSAQADLACTCYRLRKATRRLTSLYDAALAPLGLTLTQMTVLAMIGAGGPRSVSELAEALGMDGSTLSRTLRPLLAKQLLVHAAAKDRRVKRLSLTGAGADVLRDAVPLWRSAQQQVEWLLGGEVARLHGILGRLDAGLAKAAS